MYAIEDKRFETSLLIFDNRNNQEMTPCRMRDDKVEKAFIFKTADESHELNKSSF